MTTRREMPRIDAGDLFYEMWNQAHDGLSPRDSHLLDARLVLLLASRIGNLEVLRQCIELAAAPVREEAARRAARDDAGDAGRPAEDAVEARSAAPDRSDGDPPGP